MLNKIIDQFSRFFVGGLFIFSGLIKLNDPIGTQIKLEDYFTVFAQDFGNFFSLFIPYAMPLALFLVILEVVIGVAVLIQFKMEKTTWVLLLLILFFTALTFYSAYFNKVTDCGCFGDAIPLTPWQSFYKDVILVVFIGHLFWHRRRFKPTLRSREGLGVVAGTTLLCAFLAYWVLNHLPFIDFRPYKIGNNIPEMMQPQERPIIEYLFNKDGEEVRSQTFLSQKDGYQYIDSRIVNEDKIIPKITDYNVVSVDGDDYTQETFEGTKLLVITYNVEKAKVKNMSKIRELVEAVEAFAEPMVLTSSGEADMEVFRHEYQLAIPYYFVDATVLKAMVRANPGIALWKEGTVLGIWHHNDTPTKAQIEKLLK
jgi:uncharacterized membrane protein YphA (DoxX/SURF4 family)